MACGGLELGVCSPSGRPNRRRDRKAHNGVEFNKSTLGLGVVIVGPLGCPTPRPLPGYSHSDLSRLPFPRYHRSFAASRQDETSPVMPGDVLCLNCFPDGASEAQTRSLRLLHLYWDLSDGMWGLGAWREQPDGSGHHNPI